MGSPFSGKRSFASLKLSPGNRLSGCKGTSLSGYSVSFLRSYLGLVHSERPQDQKLKNDLILFGSSRSDHQTSLNSRFFCLLLLSITSTTAVAVPSPRQVCCLARKGASLLTLMLICTLATSGSTCKAEAIFLTTSSRCSN